MKQDVISNEQVGDMVSYRQMQQDIIAAARGWQGTFDAVQDMILVMDREHRILQANKSAIAAYRLPAKNIDRGICCALVHGKNREKRECLVEKVAQSHRHEEIEFQNEEDKWFVESADPIINEKGELLGVINVIKDVTESKRAQMEVAHNRLELAHIRKISTIGELAASITHEINQPLTAILSNAQAALRFLDSKTPDLKEIRLILKDIAAIDKRAGEVIRRLRVLLKNRELELGPLQISDVVNTVVEILRSDLVAREASVSIDLELDLPLILGDEVQLQQVLLNLILNGIDAMADFPPERRIVGIRACREGKENLRVSVHDRGQGISKQNLERIFSPFFTTKKDGLGMGLAVTRSIIEGHKGRLWAENNADSGATFHLVLPILKTISLEKMRKETIAQ